MRSIRVVRAITKSSGVDGVTQGGRLGVAVASAGSRSALGTSGALAQVSASARVAKWRPEALSHGSLRKGGAAWRLYALRSHALPRLIRPRPRAARTSTCLPLRMFVPSDLRLATEAHVHELARGRPGSFHAWRSMFTQSRGCRVGTRGSSFARALDHLPGEVRKCASRLWMLTKFNPMPRCARRRAHPVPALRIHIACARAGSPTSYTFNL